MNITLNKKFESTIKDYLATAGVLDTNLNDHEKLIALSTYELHNDDGTRSVLTFAVSGVALAIAVVTLVRTAPNFNSGWDMILAGLALLLVAAAPIGTIMNIIKYQKTTPKVAALEIIKSRLEEKCSQTPKPHAWKIVGSTLLCALPGLAFWKWEQTRRKIQTRAPNAQGTVNNGHLEPVRTSKKFRCRSSGTAPE